MIHIPVAPSVLYSSYHDRTQDTYATEESQRVKHCALNLLTGLLQTIHGLITEPRAGYLWLSDAMMAHACRRKKL